jgi:hypothetical protein
MRRLDVRQDFAPPAPPLADAAGVEPPDVPEAELAAGEAAALEEVPALAAAELVAGAWLVACPSAPELVEPQPATKIAAIAAVPAISELFTIRALRAISAIPSAKESGPSCPKHNL